MSRLHAASRRLAACAAAVLTMAFIGGAPARAEGTYPDRPIRMIVPFSAGGSTDQVARTLAEGLGRLWKQPVIVENRDGASGIIGSRIVAESKPDGYTLLFGTQTTQAVVPHLFARLPYDAQRDFVPVTELVAIAQLLSVPASSPFQSLGELVAYAKSHPGALTFGGGVGATPHMTMELLMSHAGIKMLGVPYKGSALAMNDLLAGRLDSMFDVIMTTLPHTRAGKLRTLAVTSYHRHPLLPAVPTVAESGYPGFETDVWFGLFAVKGTSPEIVRKIAADSKTVLADPQRRKTLTDVGFEIITSSPEDFARYTLAESEKWEKVIKSANIKME
ncbi:Bug family tripartite tricarboxylate transporter substrate binding protein [Achromobacter aloeverae]|nr:tripartite tricarboxylate transporter substrate binding protein [Achromobacter aloeverae]